MKAIIAAVLLVALAAPVAGQDTYVHMVLYPEYQYHTGSSILIPFETNLVLGGAPQLDTPVQVQVLTPNGAPVAVLNAQSLAAGVAPHPAQSHINLGKLDVGRYEFLIRATAGGASYDQAAAISVVHPPLAYDAILEGKGDDAVFALQPRGPDPNETFTIRVMRGDGNQVIHEETVWNATKVHVPSLPIGQTKVYVVDSNGWANYDNKIIDWKTGATRYPAWVWDPHYQEIEQVQDQSLTRIIVVSIVILAWIGAGATIWRVMD